jgi:hypothetical protein
VSADCGRGTTTNPSEFKTMRKFILCAALVVWLGSPALARTALDRPVALSTVARSLAALEDGPPRAALAAALDAYGRAVALGVVANTGLLTVIDYSLPSLEPRLWVLDLHNPAIVFRELVAHGRGSGENLATRFSNEHDSHMTSLGLFVTESSYDGSNGYSLRLRGLDKGLNDNAFDRAIVVHGAPYVNRVTAKRVGRLGRSWGCPAVRLDVARPLIDAIKGGSVVFAYGPRAVGKPRHAG